MLSGGSTCYWGYRKARRNVAEDGKANTCSMLSWTALYPIARVESWLRVCIRFTGPRYNVAHFPPPLSAPLLGRTRDGKLWNKNIKLLIWTIVLHSRSLSPSFQEGFMVLLQAMIFSLSRPRDINKKKSCRIVVFTPTETESLTPLSNLLSDSRMRVVACLVFMFFRCMKR